MLDSGSGCVWVGRPVVGDSILTRTRDSLFYGLNNSTPVDSGSLTNLTKRNPFRKVLQAYEKPMSLLVPLHAVRWAKVLLVVLSLGLTMAYTATALEHTQLAQFTAGGHVLGFQPDGVYVVGADHVLKVTFDGARSVAPVSNQPPSSDGQAQPLCQVTYPCLWEGVSLTYQQVAEGIVKSSYLLEPGADVDQIRLRYNVPVQLDGGGRLLFGFETGQMSESVPVAWQEIGGQRVPVEVAFRLLSDHEVGFTVGEYNPAYPLVIDPTLLWNTFLGSSDGDAGYGIALDGSGNVYVIGESTATWGSPVNAHAADGDAFVAKLSSSGVLTWNTFLGSSGNDRGRGIAVDGNGNVYPR